MSTLLTFRTGTGISSYVVHVSNDDRFPQTISTTTGTSWYVTTGTSCWIDTIVYESGYSGARAKCSANGNDWSLSSDKYVGTSTTRNITVYATGGNPSYSTNKIYFRTGSGVQKYTMVYSNATKDNLSATISSDVTSTVLDVRAGTNAVFYGVTYEPGYEDPVTFTEYGDSTFSPNDVIKTFSDGLVYSNGTRYIKLHATYAPTYYYRIRAVANGGAFSDSTTQYTTATYSTKGSGGSVTYTLSNLPTPVRLGYQFVGWGASSSSTSSYGSTVAFTATSTSSSNPTEKTVYAIWKAIEYTAYVKLGVGVSSAMVYVDGVAKSDIRDKAYHGVTILSNSVIEFRSIGKTSGYNLPYTLSFYTSATSTTPSRKTTHNTTTVSFNSTGMNMWCELSAAKKNIELFYWDSASTDASLIAKGQPISNLTAARWNRLKAKIKELAEAQGGSYTYSEVTKGTTITAAEVNGVRNAIASFSGTGVIPAVVQKGDLIYASYFNGDASIKGALNRAITTHNNS